VISPGQSGVLIDEAIELYVRDRITVEQLERATAAALAGDRDAYFLETGRDTYAWMKPMPL
jgi:hypothetical protein